MNETEANQLNIKCDKNHLLPRRFKKSHEESKKYVMDLFPRRLKKYVYNKIQTYARRAQLISNLSHLPLKHINLLEITTFNFINYIKGTWEEL